jgi:AcrR family transcriptional regulator
MLPNVVGPEGLREQKKRQARESLERAALRLFDERGFDATTIKDVADAAGMSPRTFFRYFASKEDVVFSRPGEEYAVLKGLLDKEPLGHSPLETLRSVLMKFAEHLQSQPLEDVKLRARLLATSAALRRRAGEVQQTWGYELAQELALREGVEPAPRHQLIAGVGLQAVVVAGTAWGREGGSSYTECLAEMFDELEKAVLEARDEARR